MTTLASPPLCLRSERGLALVWVSLVLVTLGGIIVASLDRQRALDDLSTYESAAPAHARDVAEAGIVDALAWFRRQTDQPVTDFAPRRDLSVDPPINETDEPDVGLVRSYEVAPRLWARYEVRIGRAAEAFTDDDGDGLYDAGEAFVDANGNGRRDPASGVRDVSAERSVAGAGIVWRIESDGAIYRKLEAAPLGAGKNVRLARALMATEIRRMAIRMPASASLCVARGDRVTVGSRVSIEGDPGAGVVYASGTGSATVLAGAQVGGSPGQTSSPGLNVSLESVFGTDLSGVRAAAAYATDDASELPSPLPPMSLVVIEGDATFDNARPLRGSAIVVVTGNCSIATGSNSFFGGVLWVGGDLTVRAPALVTGTVIVQGRADLRGLGGDHVELHQDDDVVRRLLQNLGQYRFTQAVHRVDGGDNPRPSPGGA